VRDNPELLPVCYRCGTSNPLLSPLTDAFSKGDGCASCGHPFVRSFLNFDVLPLVEFAPAAGITDEQALDMIRYVMQNPLM
jgi:intraflagellar transport protein 122